LAVGVDEVDDVWLIELDDGTTTTPAGDEVDDSSVSDVEDIDVLVVNGIVVLVVKDVVVLVDKDVVVLVEVTPNPVLAMADGVSSGPPGLPPAPVEGMIGI